MRFPKYNLWKSIFFAFYTNINNLLTTFHAGKTACLIWENLMKSTKESFF